MRSLACALAAAIQARYSGMSELVMRQSSKGSVVSDLLSGAWHEMPYSVRPAATAASMNSSGVPSA